jgi:hypothetical protein
MRRAELLERLRTLAPWIASRGIVRLRVFGSHARDVARADSDIDLIAEFATQPTLFELIEIEQELARRLGAPVDLATERGLKPRARARIDREAVDA